MTSRRGRGRGGQGGHEPRRRIRVRELQVLEQLVAGRTQHQIAATLGISQPAVSKMQRRIEERLLADRAHQIDRQRARQTLQLTYLYGQALNAWHASQQDSLRKRQRKSDGGDRGATTFAEMVSENRHGDPRYLAEARAALKDLRAVWGFDAVPSVTLASVNTYNHLTDEALDAELARYTRLLDAHAAAAPAQPPVSSPPSEDPYESR